ncbi:MAG: DMT family transporter [Prevotella sp.]|nr:DMT family transporter [Prevotella sp.]
MQYIGEVLSLGVAVSWTITALASEVATKHLGVLVANVWRMMLAALCTALLCWATLGQPLPVHASLHTWMWLLLSGVVGYFFGDWCLFNSYLTIGSRFGQLFMTLAPMFAALAAWATMGQTLGWHSLLAMAVTLSGIFISILGRGGGHRVSVQLPLKGVLFGIGAGMGQGLGLVLSKIGLDSYEGDIPQTLLPGVIHYLPFSANIIRCLAGLVCFSLWMVVRGEGRRWTTSWHDHRGMGMLGVAVVFGPFLGVGFSLMAVQFTAAGIASTLMATTPIIILLPSWYFFRQRLTLKAVVGAIVSVIGVSLFFLL